MTISRHASAHMLVFFLLVVAYASGTLAPAMVNATGTSGTTSTGAGFSSYHDIFYGYSISYPKTWKIAHDASHTTIFVAPGTQSTCQVTISATRKSTTPQKALDSSVPQGSYAISHRTVSGSPAVSFTHYSSQVKSGNGYTNATTKTVVVAQSNSVRGVNLYTVALDMFKTSFVLHNTVTPRTLCENNFEVMISSFLLPKSNQGIEKPIPGVLKDPGNPAIQYAEKTWSWWDYKGSCCAKQGDYQNSFQCAEFVARALAAEGFIGLDPYNSPSWGNNSFGSYQSYNLNDVGDDQIPPGTGLYDYLTHKEGGVDIGDHPELAVPGDVVFYYAGSPSRDTRAHVALLTETGTQQGGSDTLIDAHNQAAQDSSYADVRDQYGSLYQRTIIHLPSIAFSFNGVVLFNSYFYSGQSINITNSGSYNLNVSHFNQMTSSIALQTGWTITAYDSTGQKQKTFYASAPDLRNVYFDGTNQSVDKQISSIVALYGGYCHNSPPHNSKDKPQQFSNNSCQPPPCIDSATFIADITYPDGSAVSPTQSFNKTWELQNTGTCTWSGYSLAFMSGVQMSGPGSVPVPTTNPGQTVNITVPLVAPSYGGTYRGNWQIQNTQGVNVNGSYIWVEVSVSNAPPPPPGGSGDISLISAQYPTVVSPGQKFQPQITIQLNSGQLLQSRGDMLRNEDGNLYGAWPFVAVVGTVNPGQQYTFTFYANNPIVAPSSEGNYQSVYQVWENGAWTGPTITIAFTVKNGGGTRPNSPTPTSPTNWSYERDGSTPQLCASSSDSNVQYDFKIFQGVQTPDSGWINGNCWNPPTLGPYTFAWHVMVKNNGSGLQSDWSDTWNFSIASQQLSMDPLTFNPPSPSNVDGALAVRSCVHGFGDVNIGLSYQINSATDGSSNGEWHGFGNPGGNCADPNNPSTWGQMPSRDYADGDHLMQAIGYGPHGETMTVQATYHLNHRRPQDVHLLGPINNVRVNSDTVTFVWRPSVNAQSYNLVISPNANLSSPLFNQNVGNVTSYQYTFSQDYSAVYWQVTAINDVGQTTSDITPFGIDRVPPTASVTALPAKTTDTTFTITWSGSDNDAGIEWYNIQYRDGNDQGSQWADWQINTSAIAALFVGQPGHSYSFRAQAMDNATNLSTYAGGDGDTHTTIDVNARPQTPWWDTTYSGKRNAAILNNDSQALPTGYPMHLHFDANTSPSASDIYNASLSPNKGDDIRMVYQDTTELARYLATFTPSQIDIWFNLQASIGPNPASDNTNYQMYFGNSNAPTPPWTIDDVIPESADGNTQGLWHFQDGSGSNVTDSSGRGHTGTINNGSWNQNGKFGSAVVFNGSNTSVNLGDSPDFDVRSFTLEGWFKFYAPGIQDLIRRDNSNRNGDTYNLGTRDGKIEYGINGRSPLRSHTVFQANVWYYIAATYDGTTMAIYINGVLDNSQTDTGGTPPSVSPLMLGNNRVNSDWFKGEMQDIRISNVAHTSFLYGAFATIQSEPSTGAGSIINPPSQGSPSLNIQSVNVVPGQNGTNIMAVVVQNQGTLSTNDGFANDLYLNHQPQGPGDYTGSINSWVSSPVDANGNITLTSILPAPGPNAQHTYDNGIVESSQTFYIQADSAGVLSKYDQLSQTISGPIPVCTASPDAYESDNSPLTAKPITTDGVAQTHNFDVAGDQDWVSFTATAGMTYTMNTSNLGPNADTVLSLYGPDGTTLLASSDDYNGTPASQIIWQAQTSGTYSLQASHFSPFVGGCGTTYNLSVLQGASITSTPTSGTYKQSIKIAGTNFAANETVSIYWDSTSNPPLTTKKAGSIGSFSVNITVPQAPLGAHTLLAVGQTSHKVAVTLLQVLPKASLSQTSGVSGSSVTLTGYGFRGFGQDTSEVVNVYWGSASGPLLGTSPADGNGTTGPITFTIPPGPGGTFTLYAVGQASGAIATATFKVTSSLTIMPGSGAHGSQATLSGISFGANEIVIVKWNCRKSSCSSQTTLATVTTDANGNFSAMITIPKNAQVGTTYAIGALGKTSKAFALTSYQVTS